MSIQDVYQAVVDFDEDAMDDLILKELDNGTDIQQLLQEGLIAPMDYIGKQFSEGELFVPEMLMAAQTMKKGLVILKPKLGAGGSASSGTIVIGTVKGDLHDIGKNLVGMMLEGGGFEVIDLGVDVEPMAFVEAAKKNSAKIVGLSALLTTTMPAMEETVSAIKESGLEVKTMVGGAPVTQAFADKIGASGYSEDAPGAVELARKLML
ncbi:MAG: corrinoid protein [Deltaproteobacteria bacterium]|jgi:5-methyltetrahydrofolate--homocysteine methyltransferase|nr:corrinoid protein [Deltaproteobacteria bacterium]